MSNIYKQLEEYFSEQFTKVEKKKVITASEIITAVKNFTTDLSVEISTDRFIVFFPTDKIGGHIYSLETFKLLNNPLVICHKFFDKNASKNAKGIPIQFPDGIFVQLYHDTVKWNIATKSILLQSRLSKLIDILIRQQIISICQESQLITPLMNLSQKNTYIFLLYQQELYPWIPKEREECILFAVCQNTTNNDTNDTNDTTKNLITNIMIDNYSPDFTELFTATVINLRKNIVHEFYGSIENGQLFYSESAFYRLSQFCKIIFSRNTTMDLFSFSRAFRQEFLQLEKYQQEFLSALLKDYNLPLYKLIINQESAIQ